MRRPAKTPIDINAMTRKIDADNRIPLRNYYRIADNLLKQANIYRAEKNIIDLYIILLRYSSLVSETIPYHRDYHALYPKERLSYRKILLTVLDELESLKPEVRRQLDELGRVNERSQLCQYDGLDGILGGSEKSTSEPPAGNSKASVISDSRKSQHGSKQSLSLWKQRNDYNGVSSSNSIDTQLQNLSIGLPLPKQETLSRHSFLGPNVLSGQWLAPTAEIKVNYPTNANLSQEESLSLNQVAQDDHLSIKDGISRTDNSAMESVLSLDDGSWLRPAEESGPQFHNVPINGSFSLDIRLPSPPPVLAQVQPEYCPISPSRVADPRPGLAKTFQDGISGSDSYHHLHIPVRMMEDFLRLAQENTVKNLETCGVLAGSLRNCVFHITTLIIPKQESTSDSCQTLNEEEIFDVQDKHSLFPLGWIHTHPSQTCFMSSVDLHTHYSYQIMLPEAVAIVMAPKDESSPHGIFHLSEPRGVAVIRNCQQRGFHPHEEPEDGSPIYEHCSHVYMNPNLKFDLVDLR